MVAQKTRYKTEPLKLWDEVKQLRARWFQEYVDAKKKGGIRALLSTGITHAFLGGLGDIGYLGRSAPNKDRSLIEYTVVELLKAFTEASNVNVEFVDLGFGMLSHQVGELHGVHTADPRTIVMILLVSAAHTVDDAYPLGMRTIFEYDIASGWASRTYHSLKL